MHIRRSTSDKSVLSRDVVDIKYAPVPRKVLMPCFASDRHSIGPIGLNRPNPVFHGKGPSPNEIVRHDTPEERNQSSLNHNDPANKVIVALARTIGVHMHNVVSNLARNVTG